MLVDEVELPAYGRVHSQGLVPQVRMQGARDEKARAIPLAHHFQMVASLDWQSTDKMHHDAMMMLCYPTSS